MTIDDFIQAGYRRYSDCFNNADFLLQKKIVDANSICFFIEIYVYQYPSRVGFMPQVQFTQGEFPTMNVTLVMTEEEISVGQIEKHFIEIWNRMGRPYYENCD